jgi:ribosomal protein S18 acetylase RimI-like enzyme
MKVRPARKRDFAGIKQIFELAFTEEYQQREVNIVDRIEKIESFYPLVRALSLFPNPYQHVFTVHVLEDEGQIAAMAQLSPRNQNQSRWHIDNIAVHPDFRGRGLAQAILNGVFDYYRERGALRFTLEVDLANTPAIKLYEKLGFRRYSTLTYFKLMPKRLAKYKEPEESVLPEGLRERRPADTKPIWELYQDAIPPYIRVVEDRSPQDVALSPLQLGAEWLKKSLKRSQALHLVVEDSHNRIVASLDLFAQLRSLPHVIQMTVHPGHGHLAEPLLKYALNQLASVSLNPVLIGCYECQRAKQDGIKSLGFKKLTADFLMVRDTLETLGLTTGQEVLQTDGFFNPTVTFDKHS